LIQAVPGIGREKMAKKKVIAEHTSLLHQSLDDLRPQVFNRNISIMTSFNSDQIDFQIFDSEIIGNSVNDSKKLVCTGAKLGTPPLYDCSPIV
jgi:hypothetical protein